MYLPVYIEIYPSEQIQELLLPYYEGIKAGFPSPAADYMESEIDLMKILIKNPASTFLGKVKGNSMQDAGIDDGDFLVIDKSCVFNNNKIAVCFLNGEFTLKRIQLKNGDIILMPANSSFKPIKIDKGDDFEAWGVVTYVIKKV